MKKIPSEQTGTIAIENLSKDISLINPSWVVTAGDTTSLVPWDIKPSGKGKVTWRSPFGGVKLADTFKHTIFFLSYQIAGTNYHIIFGTMFPLKLALQGKTVFTIFVMETPEYATIKANLQQMADAVVKVDIKSLGAHLAANKLISGSNPHIVGIDSTKLERYYEWQFPIFTPQVKLKRTEYHVNIVAAVGFGKAMGVTAQIEVLPGASLNAAKFKTQNPQVYTEPVATATTISRPAILGSQVSSQNMADEAMATNQIQPNPASLGGKPVADSTQPQTNVENTPAKTVPGIKVEEKAPGTTGTEANVANTPATTAPEINVVNIPATLPNDVSTGEKLPTDGSDLGIDYVVRRSDTKSSATLKKLLVKNRKRELRRILSKRKRYQWD